MTIVRKVRCISFGGAAFKKTMKHARLGSCWLAAKKSMTKDRDLAHQRASRQSVIRSGHAGSRQQVDNSASENSHKIAVATKCKLKAVS